MAENPSILQEIDIMRDTYTKYLDRQMQLAGGRSKAILRKNKNYATSQLIQSVSGSAYSEGDNIVGSFGANTSYAKDIEDGFTKSKPSPDLLIPWVRRKVALGHMVLRSSEKSNTEQQIEDIATGVSKKICETGLLNTKPYIQPSADILIAKLTNDFPLELK